MRSRSNGGIIGAYQLPTQNRANGVFFIHDAGIYNTGNNPIWPLGTGYITSATGGTISTAVDNSNYKLHTFTANGTFTVTTGSAYIEILMCGGGGGLDSMYYYPAGTYHWGCGGGGGGTVAIIQNTYVDAGTTFTVEVGQGGAYVYGNNGNSAVGNNGKPSKITSNKGHSVIARGGGKGGGGSTTYNPGVGGPSGGSFSFLNYNVGINYQTSIAAGGTDAYTLDSTATITYYQNRGGAGQAPSTITSTTEVNAGGGGGAGEPGYAGLHSFNPALSSYGGNGYQWNRTGLYYGAGGAGGAHGRTAYSGLYANGLRLGEANNGVDGYGVGASGMAQSWYSSSGYSQGYAGGAGTIIFCYRYR